MAGGILLKGNRFTDVGTAVSVPSGTALHAIDNDFERVRKVLDVRDAQPSFEEAKKLLLSDPRLPEGTTWDELREGRSAK